MRRAFYRFLLPLFLLLLACRALVPVSGTPAPPASPPVLTLPALPGASTPDPTPGSGNSQGGSSQAVVPPSESPQPTAPLATAPAPETALRVLIHPDGSLYAGDLVSIEVLAPQDNDLRGYSVQVQVDAPDGKSLAAVDFGNFGIGGRPEATLLWAWDTSGLQAGEHSLTFSVLPQGPTWTEQVTLLPGDQVPPPEPQAKWAQASSQCCILYYITGTAAERDLQKLLETADEQATDVSQRMGAKFGDPVPVVLLPRLLGHGGFTSKEIEVSYLDRNYAGSSFALVLHHEMVHLLDGRLGGDLRPTILVEGLAVYLTGGHFKKEALMPRAAALLPPIVGCVSASYAPGTVSFNLAGPVCSLDRYLPLRPLTDNFYFSQHEIGYIEAGSLVEYMLETWGWQDFSAFYRDIHSRSGESQSQVMDAALQQHFGITFDELETRYIKALRQEEVTEAVVEDVRLTVAFYNTVRRYQQILDPSAYFLNAWIPDADLMRQRGIVADYLRHPDAPENVAIETLLVSADESLLNGDYERMDRTLQAINAMLDVYSHPNTFFNVSFPQLSLKQAFLVSPGRSQAIH